MRISKTEATPTVVVSSLVEVGGRLTGVIQGGKIARMRMLGLAAHRRSMTVQRAGRETFAWTDRHGKEMKQGKVRDRETDETRRCADAALDFSKGKKGGFTGSLPRATERLMEWYRRSSMAVAVLIAHDLQPTLTPGWKPGQQGGDDAPAGGTSLAEFCRSTSF